MALRDLRQQAIRRSPGELVAHLNSFELELKFSAGIWFFSPPNSRFHDKYGREIDIEARLEIAAGLKDYGLGALEAHYPNEVNEDNAELWQNFCKDTGIKLIGIAPLLFWDQAFEWGSLSNPIPEKRKIALDRAKATLRLTKRLDTEFAIVWPGIDGYENPFGVDFTAMRDRFVDGLVEAMDEVPGVRIAFEPKPYEPRGHILFPTTVEGVMLGHLVESKLSSSENRKLLDEGHTLFCLNPEIGHVLMGYEDLAYAFSWPLSEGRLAHSHFNSQPLGNYDQDLNVGVVAPEQLEALLYTMKTYGYTGWFGIDINPERMPVDTALKISMDAIRAANDRINAIDHESVLYCQQHPDKTRGWLEAYLVRQRAPRPENLPPLWSLK
ncbi:MAG: TIM barrel protein [Planctomycetes bacterium]|nr:TIM barrel protein [Planctomycetota bacterium]